MSEVLRIIDSRCVKPDEWEEVAAWCHGDLGVMYEGHGEGQNYIDVAGDRATVGDWIISDGLHFKRISDEEYRLQFQAAIQDREKYIKILELVSDAIHAAAPHVIHGVGVDRHIVAEQATLQIMQIL